MPEIFIPDSDAQLLELVQAGLANDSPFSITGQNTKADFGYTQKTDTSICMSAFNGIIDYEPAELVMRAKAGTPLADIEAALLQHNQHLPFEPPNLGKLYDANSGAGTIGGTFMANLSGPRRFIAGAARDYILGVKAVSGRGEIYKSGGNVIKNVTGYDLSKLLTGSWGTLSIVTELSFKVLPAPPASISIGIAGLPEEALLNLLSVVAQSPLGASGLALIPAAISTRYDNKALSSITGNLGLIRLEGSSLSVQERRKALLKLLPDANSVSHYEDEQSKALWRSIADVDLFNPAGRDNSIVKLSIAPTTAQKTVKLLSSIDNCQWYADAAGAWLWLSLDNDNAVENLKLLRRSLSAHGSSAILYRTSDEIKRQAGLFNAMSTGLLALTQRLKNCFDPHHILNPQRLFLGQ